MKKLYNWILSWANKKSGGVFLFFLSMIESIIFPIPPDTLLMPLCLGNRAKAFRFALLCTVGSLVGAAIGYYIGYALWWSGDHEYSALALWFFDLVPSFSEEKFTTVKDLYEKYNVWIVFIAAFTPLPFKVVTITAGAFKVQFLLFIVGSTIGRAGRFFLVAWLLRRYGNGMKVFIDKYFNLLSIAFVILLVGGIYVLKVVLH